MPSNKKSKPVIKSQKRLVVLGLIALGALLMLIFSNIELQFKYFNQHAISRDAAGATEDIKTRRTELTFTPTKEWVPVDLFGGAKPKEEE